MMLVVVCVSVGCSVCECWLECVGVLVVVCVSVDCSVPECWL
jgi:hypothetical protein